jgi:hypothetical protein
VLVDAMQRTAKVDGFSSWSAHSTSARAADRRRRAAGCPTRRRAAMTAQAARRDAGQRRSRQRSMAVSSCASHPVAHRPGSDAAAAGQHQRALQRREMRPAARPVAPLRGVETGRRERRSGKPRRRAIP